MVDPFFLYPHSNHRRIKLGKRKNPMRKDAINLLFQKIKPLLTAYLTRLAAPITPASLPKVANTNSVDSRTVLKANFLN